MKTNRSRKLLAAALAALALGAGAAQAATPLPPLQHSGGVEYLSGGIGQDEARAIEGAARHWPLTLEFAVKDKRRADFAADVKVLVRDAKGHTALDATAGGPFLLAKLAPGHYSVEASLAGKTLHEKVLVKAGHPVKAAFLWPARTGESHVGQKHS
jgi:hypothetical protein